MGCDTTSSGDGLLYDWSHLCIRVCILCIHVSASPADPTGRLETSPVARPGDSSDSMVAQTAVVSNYPPTDAPPVSSVPGNDRSASTPYGEWHPASTSQCPLPLSHGMEHRNVTFSQRVRNTIDNSRKPSTRKSYLSKWRRFLSWLPTGWPS